MKKQARTSNRNRHTGRINHYRQSIIDNGKRMTIGLHSYYGMVLGKNGSSSIVRA